METKAAVFQIRLTEGEKRLIQENAQRLGLSMGRYLVMLAIQDRKEQEKGQAANQTAVNY